MQVDFVFPYVNPNDVEWQRQHIRMCHRIGRKVDLSGARYRDWGLLKYVFRSIEQYAPFIRNVYMIVESMQQVPSWVNTDKVNIVLHSDIIPKQYLPTYNSCTIEMFLHNIPGLSEYFIYSNDDLYFMNMCTINNFYNTNMVPIVKLKQIQYDEHSKLFRVQCANCEDLFLPTEQKCINRGYVQRTYHTMTPMRRSTCQLVYEKYHDIIHHSISTFRNKKNFNQYIYPMYERYVNNATSQNFITSEYVAIGRERITNITYKILSTQCQVMCINDTKSVKSTEITNDMIRLRVAFNRRLAKHSIYEKF